MSASETNTAARTANDGFEEHYAEKIWSLVPEIYRFEDGLAESPGQLRGLVELLATQAAVARRGVDRLWADTRIADADDWAVPYIGALVGTRPVSDQNRGAQRAAAGNEVAYRRRAGTTTVIERLADDIADWDAVASEAFKRLHRYWHRLDCGPEIGAITCTPRGGYADLRAARIDEVLDEAFDDLAHTVDVRRIRGAKGRYSISKVNLHLYRQYAFELSGIDPFDLGDGHFTLDPSGRDVPLFQRGGIDEADCVATREWHVRAPITCRLLQAGGFSIDRGDAPPGLEEELRSVYGRTFKNERDLLTAANAGLAGVPGAPNSLSDTNASLLVARGLLAETPRQNLLPGGDAQAESVVLTVAATDAGEPFGPSEMYAANLEQWGATHVVPGWVQAVVDPERGRFRSIDPIPTDRRLHVQKIFYGTFFPVGAGTYDRGQRVTDTTFTPVATTTPDLSALTNANLQFGTSQTYEPVLGAGNEIVVTGSLTLAAINGERPYVRFDVASGESVTIRNDGSTDDGELLIDGMWLGAAANGDTVTELIIDGPWRKVVVRASTIDPGGDQAVRNGAPPSVLPEMQLVLRGSIGEVQIDRSVTGGIEERISEFDPCSLDVITICDSIVGGANDAPAAVVRNAQLCAEDSTFFGDVIAGRIDASGIAVDGRALAENEQDGCFRFSAAAADSAVPHPYRSVFFDGGLPHTTFVSTRFGDPGYAQLREIAPIEVREQNEHGREMGAFARALDPIKRQDLAAKLAEYSPVNIAIQMIFET